MIQKLYVQAIADHTQILILRCPNEDGEPFHTDLMQTLLPKRPQSRHSEATPIVVLQSSPVTCVIAI